MPLCHSPAGATALVATGRGTAKNFLCNRLLHCWEPGKVTLAAHRGSSARAVPAAAHCDGTACTPGPHPDRVHPYHHNPCSRSQPSLGCHQLGALALRCPPVPKAQVARLPQEILAGQLEVLPGLGGHMCPRGGGIQLWLQHLLQTLELPVLGNGPCTPEGMSDGALPCWQPMPRM